MNFKELVDEVSSRSGVGTGAVKKVLDATFATVADKVAAGTPVRFKGFGTFLLREAKKGEPSRVVFRQWLTDDQKQSKKEDREARRAAVTN